MKVPARFCFLDMESDIFETELVPVIYRPMPDDHASVSKFLDLRYAGPGFVKLAFEYDGQRRGIALYRLRKLPV